MSHQYRLTELLLKINGTILLVSIQSLDSNILGVHDEFEVLKLTLYSITQKSSISQLGLIQAIKYEPSTSGAFPYTLRVPLS